MFIIAGSMIMQAGTLSWALSFFSRLCIASRSLKGTATVI